MKYIITLFFFFATITRLYSQELITNDTVYKSGIYKTFEEFKYNSPSLPFNYNLKPVTYNLRGGAVSYHRIKLDKKTAKCFGEIFGFCDGKHVYILDYPREVIPNTRYMQLQRIASLCYFEDRKSGAGYNNSHTVHLQACVLNLNTGKITEVNQESIQHLMASRPDLLEQFNNEEKKHKKCKEYILKFIDDL